MTLPYLTPEQLWDIDWRFPNARHSLEFGWFISHSGEDYQWIRENLIGCFQNEKYFFYSKCYGKEYEELVLLSLHYCDKFVLVVSERSSKSEWVSAEVEWAIGFRRPMILCLLDETNPGKINKNLENISNSMWNRFWGGQDRFIVDFRCSNIHGQDRLGICIQKILKRYPVRSSYRT
jgi:hypothetical protein